MANITPQFMYSFQQKMHVRIFNEWDRIIPKLKWDKVMKQTQSTSLRDVLVWLLNTVKIHERGSGGNTRFDDMVAFMWEIENRDRGNSLKLTRNNLEDEQLLVGGNVVDVFQWSGQWAAQTGGASAYWPQKKLIELMLGGLTQTGYDGVPFWSNAHPLNPYTQTGGVYTNLHTDLALSSPEALAEAVARVNAIRGTNGENRHLEPRYLVCGPDLRYNAYTFLDAKEISGTTNSLTRYGIEPLVFNELNEPGVFYLVMEDMMDGEMGPFIYQERKPFQVTSYAAESSAALDRREEFEWHNKGRNVATYGHPYLAVRFQPNP